MFNRTKELIKLIKIKDKLEYNRGVRSFMVLNHRSYEVEDLQNIKEEIYKIKFEILKELSIVMLFIFYIILVGFLSYFLVKSGLNSDKVGCVVVFLNMLLCFFYWFVKSIIFDGFKETIYISIGWFFILLLLCFLTYITICLTNFLEH